MSESSEAILEMEARPDPYIGKVLAGRYKIIRVIGTGGMGAVYEAEHTLIGRRVAVKILYSQLASDAAVVKRFVNEARAAATIGHPHILECTDIGQADDGSPFLVLELLEGHDLDGEFEQMGPMPIGRLAMLLRQACDALAVAHDKGIIHRDIKPENIYLSVQKGQPDHVKVLDFGISKFNSMKQTGPGTMSGSAMGTPYYMSPEQFRDASNVDQRADIYAMGVILYQGLAGRLPFMADNLPGLALEIATGTPIPLEAIRPDLPADLVALVSRSMARSASERVQSMTELRDELSKFVHLDAPVEVRAVDAQNLAHMRTAQALDIPGARRSQIRVKTDGTPDDGADGRKSNTPIIAVGLLLAVVGGGAGIYASTRPAQSHERPKPAAQVAVTPPAPAPAPVAAATAPPAPAAIAKQPVSITADVEGATATLRGQTVPLPYTADLDSSTTPEVIDVAARGRTTLRYVMTVDRPRTLFASLSRGSGQRVATDSELAVALTGPPTGDSSDRGSSHGSTATPSTTTTAPMNTTTTPPPAMTTEARPPNNVYTGPSGDLPEL